MMMRILERLAQSQLKICRMIASRNPSLSLPARIKLCNDSSKSVRQYAISFLPKFLSVEEGRNLADSTYAETRIAFIKRVNSTELSESEILQLANSSYPEVQKLAKLTIERINDSEMRKFGKLLIALCEDKEASIRSVASSKLPNLFKSIIDTSDFQDVDFATCHEALIKIGNDNNHMIKFLGELFLYGSNIVRSRVLKIAHKFEITSDQMCEHYISMILEKCQKESIKKASGALHELKASSNKIEDMLLSILWNNPAYGTEVISSFRDEGSFAIPQSILDIESLRKSIRELIIQKDSRSEPYINDEIINKALKLLQEFGDFEAEYYFEPAIHETWTSRRPPTEEEIRDQELIYRTSDSDTYLKPGSWIEEEHQTCIKKEEEGLLIKEPNGKTFPPILDIKRSLSKLYESLIEKPTETKMGIYRFYTGETQN